MSRLRKRELPARLTQRMDDESYADYAIRRAAAYTVRDNQRSIRDIHDNPALVATLRTQIGRRGYPPLDATQEAA